MPRSQHYYSAAEPEGVEGDDSLLALSLGAVYSNNSPPAARTSADGRGARSPVVSPVVGTGIGGGALSDATDAVHQGGGFAFPEVSLPTLSQIATMPFSHNGNGVIPALPAVHGEVTPPAPTKRSAKRLRARSRAPGHSGADSSAVPAKTSNGSSEIEGGLHLSPPFPWSTERLGVHHSLAELSKRGIDTITGELQCKRCDDLKLVLLDLKAKFKDLCSYVSCNIHGMDDRAPQRWKEPALPDCDKCGQKNSMRPVIPAEKHKINWVFLLLSEMLGLCTLEQLKYFCEHTQQHRTGAKDRVLYSTYMELCNQLLPNGIFDMASERQKRSRPNA